VYDTAAGDNSPAEEWETIIAKTCLAISDAPAAALSIWPSSSSPRTSASPARISCAARTARSIRIASSISSRCWRNPAEPLSRAEVVRDVRRYSRTICPVKKCRLHANSFEGGDRADAFQGARIPDDGVRDLLGTFCNLNRLLDYVNYPLEPSEYWWQLEEQLSQELDGIDTIFGNLLAPLSSCGIVGAVDVHQPSFGYNLSLHLVVLTVNARLILNLFY
ncbi:unnamed protein product, partial [Trichogramma brassicae]